MLQADLGLCRRWQRCFIGAFALWARVALQPIAAQDIHLTQYYLNPLTVNPAQCGNFEPDFRFSGIHRNQWQQLGKPYQTTSLGFERNIFFAAEYISVGLAYVHDQSGTIDLKSDRVYISAAYHKKLGPHRFHGGVQGGPVVKSFNTDLGTLPDQYDRNTGGFNTDLPTSEPLQFQQKVYADWHTGFAYGLERERWSADAGIAFFHINRPDESFFGQPYLLPIRTTLTAFGTYLLNDKFSLHPTLLYSWHSKASEMLAGGRLTYYLLENQWTAKGIYMGLMFRDGLERNKDAAIVALGMDFKRIRGGISYDITISELGQANNRRGAWEIAIIYYGLRSKLPQKSLPCDRY
ncbi:MAG: PorP/SprF family type IX secretion system membrane protein [Flavobacteriales bacterium]|nr:PorP/SprF family type IX secretion system membrane protein [Flavobacteriales bacterium]